MNVSEFRESQLSSVGDARQRKGYGRAQRDWRSKTKNTEAPQGIIRRKESENDEEETNVNNMASIHYMNWKGLSAKQAHFEGNLDKGSTIVLKLPINSLPSNHAARFRLRIKERGRFVRMYAIVSTSPVVPNQHNFAWASGLGTQLKDEKLQTFVILPQFLGKSGSDLSSNHNEGALLEAGQEKNVTGSTREINLNQVEQAAVLYIAIHNLSARTDHIPAPKKEGRLDDRSPIFTPSDAAGELKPFSPTREEEAMLLGKLPTAPVALVLDVFFLQQPRNDAKKEIVT